MATHAPHAFHGGASFDALGSDFAALERRGEIVDADVLDAWYEPSPRVLAALRDHLPWLVKTSPPTHGGGLRAAIANRHGLAPGRVLVGGGSSALMYLALPRLVRPGCAVALLDPTYGEYRHLCEHVLQARVVACELDERDGFRPDPARIAAAVRAQGASLLVLVNPNSPTGGALDAGGLRALLAALPSSTRVWIDETYVDFAPDVPTAEPLVAGDPRVLVAKSMSKFFALSGLRIGYLCADPGLVAQLEPWNPPWSAGLLAQVAAMRALEDYGWYRERAAETRALREELAARIDALPGLRTFPGTANFVLFATARVPAAELVERCRARGVFLRDCSSLSPRLGGRFVRTAVKDRAGNARIAAALAAVAS
jgi:histidinol-phosphate/aromatic aminotransferase/cobyric acid decarboxylase-like protein